MPLSLFRRKKKNQEVEQAPPPAAAPQPEPEPTIVALPATGPAPDGQQIAPKKRRRGSRGGRGRKKKTELTAATSEVAEGEAPIATPAPAELPAGSDGKPAERKPKEQRQKQPRRAPRRAPLPKARRELLVSVDAGEKRVAVLEDDRVAEVYLERPEQRSIAGNVYLGTVDNVLPGMEAAFVEIGLEKNGFLYVDEIVGPELEGRRGARKIQDLIQKGQTILVQAVKDPMKTKGARLTTEISLPGRFVVFVPHGDGLGVSRRLDDDERNRLKAALKDIAPAEGGVIVRTAAEGASAEDIARDLDFLRRLWKTIAERAAKSQAPALIYQEAELPLRVTRDLFTGDFERLVVDNDRAHKRIVGYLKKTSPHMVDRVARYRDAAPLMEAFGVEQEIRSTLNRRVDLPSGGYLIFDYAEAFTVIDVNTGRFVGSRSKRSEGRLEDTITKNNLEAVKEVVRQLRLRDVGGIIVIDFIDMANPRNRTQVEEALRQELERDRTKTYVVEISPLGLVEMTRQNVTDGPREVMTRKCPTCEGDGIVVSESTTAVEIERKLRALVTPGSRSKAFKVEVNAKIASLVAGPGASRLRELEEATKRRFLLVGLDDVHLDHFQLLEKGPLEKVAGAAEVEEGQELSLKLVEVGLYDPRAGVAKVNGTEIRVAEAAGLVGKKVRLHVNAVMDGVAYSELLDGHDTVEPPITAEAEAEKPTRATRAAATKPRKAKATEREEDADAAEPELEADSADAAAEVETEVKPATKKRTRRGTRGGRNRRSKATAETAAEPAEAAPDEAPGDGAAEPESGAKRSGTKRSGTRARKSAEPNAEAAPEAEDKPVPDKPVTAPKRRTAKAKTPTAEESASAPLIHLPDPGLGRDGDEPSENGEEGVAPKKRTRRGTRGGRNRRRKPAAAVAGEAPDSQSAAPPAAETSGDWKYTPMSEWEDI